MNLADLATYLSDQGVGEVQGTAKDIFVYSMPDTVSQAVLLLEREGGTPIDHELPGYFRTGCLVVIRDTEYVRGRQKADLVSSTLKFENQVVGSMKMLFIRPVHEPIVFPASSGDYLEWMVLFDAVYTSS